MEPNKKSPEPDNTAVRTALWRAIHLEIDAKPAVIEDEIGLKLIAPQEDWQQRPDMHADFTKRLRASIVARARFIEDLIIDQSEKGIAQYVLLGAGLDTFAQRRPDIASKLQIFEIDQPETQEWKQQRLNTLGYGIPDWLHFVSVDFEQTSWFDELIKAGFNINKPAVIACTGVTLYLTKEAIMDTLHKIAQMAQGSVLAMTFYLPLALMDEADQQLQMIGEKGAREAGTPFVSFFPPEEVLIMAHEAGLKNSRIISTKDMKQRYFKDRTDGLTPASGEMFLICDF
ncbi:class I SAM-dependent methyltransferase [Taibaiella soli]|uniref:S-adenosyl-L-methionine-dependent methyltransferase n=1 Tax=Taibaiella soli TaxID=1649169 RepID=A0A2W2C2N8_9BACT|nr:class I SAM-dependent methyltransferase [Taibaiella soli]PZF74363.1 SAM-dependent methyltransferase [Taibaiella soli]